ncbi:hypothetical protein, partial [Klebsiella pneumoniae]|uniref:hypothetical protein n=1 Tax=Klebsiella pneumoniae TaxID=573 RepID=UPI00312E9DE7
RITPSVAEQEGQQTETEATGAPQKHHYTLNQQVGSITHLLCLSLSLVCRQDQMPGRISLIRRVFSWIYYLPLQGKEISPLPARVSKSDGIFWSRDVYHKAKESGGGNAWP